MTSLVIVSYKPVSSKKRVVGIQGRLRWGLPLCLLPWWTEGKKCLWYQTLFEMANTFSNLVLFYEEASSIPPPFPSLLSYEGVIFWRYRQFKPRKVSGGKPSEPQINMVRLWKQYTFRTNSRNIIGRNPSMVIPLLANQAFYFQKRTWRPKCTPVEVDTCI